MKLIINFASLLLGFTAIDSVVGHGYQYEPSTRNWVANTLGVSGSQEGLPKAEYCPHCLNRNKNICGVSEDGTDYDMWLDSTGKPMSWNSQGVYAKGDIIEVRSFLTAHHAGHMEIKGCPNGRESTRECFDEHVLTFERDINHGMPKDPAHPERGYYAGGAGWNGNDFAMEFKLPESLVGKEVLLQWRYITANSCLPPDYAVYFEGANSDGERLPDEYWNAGVPNCSLPIPEDGDLSLPGSPEQFFNCAEVTVLGENVETNAPTTKAPTSTSAPTQAPVTTSSPVTNSPTTKAPTLGPTIENQATPAPTPAASGGTCGLQWANCKNTGYECCPDYVCEAVDEWTSQCQPDPQATCLKEWEGCSSDDDCCNGLQCDGNEHWKSCKRF